MDKLRRPLSLCKISGLIRIATLHPNCLRLTLGVTRQCPRLVNGGLLSLAVWDFRPLSRAPFQGALILLPRPKYYLTKEEEERRNIIYHTYLSARDCGDNNVYFIDGRKLMELVGDNGTVDGAHPTDSGFLSMACAIGEVLEEIFKTSAK